jgi:hypothetical protein
MNAHTPDVAQAIFGLIGVVVGGMLTGGVSYALGRAEQNRELRRTRRLIISELSTAWMHLTLVVRHGPEKLSERIRRDKPDDWMPTQIWRSHKAEFAGSRASEEEWRRIDTIYDSLVVIREGLLGGAPFATEDFEDLRDQIWEALHAAGRIETEPDASTTSA